MFVDTAMLHSGAAESHRASEHAQHGTNHLARISPMAGMFGDFEGAHDFHQAVTQAHTRHNARLRDHQEILSNVGDKARSAASVFTDMEEHNAAKLRAVRCSYTT